MNKIIKNIGIYAHVDAGKTTLTEQLLYHTGVIRSAGRVDDGNTHTDTMDLERERGISIMSAPISFMHAGEKINIIDTPGHVDFVAEVERSMLVLDAAILVISAKESVQSHTKLLFQALKRQKVPTLIFINKIDRMGVKLVDVFEDIDKLLTDRSLPLQTVTDEGARGAAVSDLFGIDHESLAERLALYDDAFFERYLSGELNRKMMEEVIRTLMSTCQVYPLLFGSAMHGVGISGCLEAIHKLMDAPAYNSEEALGGIVFKVQRNHVKTKESFIKLTTGHIGVRELIGEDKITKIEALIDGELVKVDRLYAGDIGIVQGLQHYPMGSSFGIDQTVTGEQLAKPTLKVKILPEKFSKRKQLLDALEILSEADPYLEFELNEFNDDIYLKLFGFVQMDIVYEMLLRRFDLSVTYKDPMTIYMETLKSQASYEVRMYEEGLPFHAAVGFRVSPLPIGSGIVYESLITTGYLKQTFQNAVEEGVFEFLDQGLLGWEITDMKVELISYMFSSVCSSPKDYRDLAPLVLFEAIRRAGTYLLWPISRFDLSVPLDKIGKSIADLSRMKATFDEPIIKDGNYLISGTVPIELSHNYALEVHAYTSGKGYFETKFSGYEPAPEWVVKEREKFKTDPSNRSTYLMSKSRVI
ncbi:MULTISPECIES: translation factor GTPase family protein [unclassified Fusibacter]|uniref:elongation factor G n=1 Tax=unclassified Fusibacter TaxID=2624464 RepID=UPI0013E950A8|nr:MULTISPECIES: TetM/TetW/TetO/TetS family tetracycline resistance ribosomal protection protein [unclassified Fusibacter]MCK8059675.1 TetM/TetW/TetO/TetS family tetracycline resistance ribosomal protection protein [Fusibacter sp. A2]NPE21476.1 TetM/TetW/TetO/TetS family tetracycline resistance ribosomal protection protein [Fusibacter sp. A1]